MLTNGILYKLISGFGILMVLIGISAHTVSTGIKLAQNGVPRLVDCTSDDTAPVIVYPAAGLQANLDACELNGAATFFFSISVSDNCDPSPTHSVELSMGTASQLFLRRLGGGHYLVIAQPGGYLLTASAMDESGNTSQVQFSVNVTQEPAPGTNYACNDSLNISLNDNCQRVLTPDMLLEGDISCTPVEFFDITVIDGMPENGPIVDGVGVYNYELSPVQPSPTEGFVQSFAPNQWQTSSRGNGRAAISLDSLVLSGEEGASIAAAVYTFNQDATIAFDWGAEGMGNGLSLTAFLLESDGQSMDILSMGNGSGTYNTAVEPGQSLVFYLSGNGVAGELATFWVTNFSASFENVNIEDLFPCWGVVRARDLTKPILECPEDTDLATVYTPVQQFGGQLDTNDPQVDANLYSCLIENFNAPGQRYYELIEFEVTEADVYTFILDSGFSSGDGDMALFQGVFNPFTPCANIIGQADFPQAGNPLGGGTDPFLRISLPMQAGQTYQLLTTSDEPLATGSYQYFVLSDGAGSLTIGQVDTIPLTFPLFCDDLAWVEGSDSLQWTGAPIVTDNCSDFTLTYNEISEEEGDCGAQVLRRFFRAEDAAGNVSNCAQRINFRRPTIDDVTLPPFTVPIECGVDFPLDEFGSPSPEFTGYPYLLTAQGVRDLRDDYCNIGATYDDSPPINICVASLKFIRNWTIVDWCDPVNTTNYAQIIKIGDFTPPTVECPIVDVDGDGFPDPPIYPAASFECTGALWVPMPEVSDACSNVKVDVEIVTDRDSVVFNAFGQAVDTVLQTIVLARVEAENPDKSVAGIPVGCHRFRYIVTDDCGNIAVHECGFCIEDSIDPVAVCDDEIIASVGLNGNLILFASQIDEGSWDNCGIDSMSVRRRVTIDENCEGIQPFFTPWDSFVQLGCCDVGSTVTIELLVVDTAGNSNTCSTQVVVEDKAKPRCFPPPNVTIDCGALPAGFDPDSLSSLAMQFGEPEVQDNCQDPFWEELPPVNNLDDCSVGTLIRRFRAVDASGNISEGACQQVVTITSYHDYNIKFPKDAEANCGIPNPDTIEVFEFGCDLLAVSVADTLLSASGDACYKIFRTYRVINWCEYDGESPAIRIGRDEDCDELPGDEDVWVSRLPDQAYVDRDGEPANSIPSAGAKGNICDGQTNPEGYWRTINSRGYWQYQQHIIVYDTVPPVIDFLLPPPICSNNNETCRAAAEFLFVVSDNCTPDDLDIRVLYDEFSDGTIDSVITEVFGSYPKYKLSGDYPIGMHEFEIIVEDGCGNVASADLPFEVVDCKAPAPACINGLSLALMPVLPQTDVDGDGDFDKGAHIVFAESLVASDYVDCSMPLTYSINRAGETPDINQSSLVVTCDDLGVLIVELYAWDAADNPYQVQPDGTMGGPNYDFCETFVIVDENLVGCTDSLPSIGGMVMREDSMPVADVEMRLTDGLDLMQWTDSTGQYVFEELPVNYDFTLTPRRDGDDQNGISTYDIALINKHILGIEPLDSPYKRIAADVNNSGTISTLDIIQLRQVLLSVLVEFPHSDSWRFVTAAHEFPNPENPWETPIPDAISYDNLQSVEPSQDFIAVKIGDIDLSAHPDLSKAPNGMEDRSNQVYELRLEDRWLSSGELVKVPVQADLSTVLGFQGVLEVDTDQAAIIGVEESYCNTAHYNTAHLPIGLLPFSWNEEAASGLQTLFYLNLRVKRNTRLSDLMRIADSRLQAEAYAPSGERSRLRLGFQEEGATILAPSLFPNPFRQQAVLEFELAAAQSVAITVHALNGAELHTENMQLSAGWHQWRLEEHYLPGNGVYLLRLHTDEREWTTKVIRLE
jgi:hypothetical protein